MTETITAIIHVHRLEPGKHIAKKIIERDVVKPVLVELPKAECMEPRPDWGQYLPVVTFTAIEKALKVRGHFPQLEGDLQYSYGIQK